MAKKQNKTDMPDMFEQAISDKTAEYNRACKNIQEQIDCLENQSDNHDSGLSDAENRLEINSLNNKLNKLEQEHKKEIESLRTYKR